MKKPRNNATQRDGSMYVWGKRSIHPCRTGLGSTSGSRCAAGTVPQWIAERQVWIGSRPRGPEKEGERQQRNENRQVSQSPQKPDLSVVVRKIPSYRPEDHVQNVPCQVQCESVCVCKWEMSGEISGNNQEKSKIKRNQSEHCTRGNL